MTARDRKKLELFDPSSKAPQQSPTLNKAGQPSKSFYHRPTKQNEADGFNWLAGRTEKRAVKLQRALGGPWPSLF